MILSIEGPFRLPDRDVFSTDDQELLSAQLQVLLIEFRSDTPEEASPRRPSTVCERRQAP
jgi:hypothetical protein